MKTIGEVSLIQDIKLHYRYALIERRYSLYKRIRTAKFWGAKKEFIYHLRAQLGWITRKLNRMK